MNTSAFDEREREGAEIRHMTRFLGCSFCFVFFGGSEGERVLIRESPRKKKILKNTAVVMPMGCVLPRAVQGFPVLSWGLITQCLCHSELSMCGELRLRC